jgi:C-terminal processing protease CtpA/Prc
LPQVTGLILAVLLSVACASRQPTLIPTPTAMPIPTPMPTSPPSGDEQVMANLAAFARLYGYVRYFHPSDEAADLDWNQVAINGVLAVRDATSPADLAQKLAAFFQPCAPTVCVFPVAEPPAIPDALFPSEDAAALRVVMWRHYGVENDIQQSIYHSDRLWEAAPAGEVPSGFHDPRDPFYADLGGGIAALIPLALFADGEGTLPHSTLSEGDLPDQFEPYDQSALSLAGVIIAWNVFQHFYPYFDVVETDWPQVLRDALMEALVAVDKASYYKTLLRLVAQLHDGHGNVIYETSYSPRLLPAWVEDRLIVLHAEGEAAESLQPGDVILKVDGQPAAEAIADLEELMSAATPQAKRLKAVFLLLSGPYGSKVTLEAQNESGDQIMVSLKRTSLYWQLKEPRPERIEELELGIFYLDLERVGDAAFNTALPQLESARGIIFDLRGYPSVSSQTIGHLIDEPVTSPQWHVPIVTYPDQQNVIFDFVNWEREPKAPRLTARIAFLTDGRAISYAETYLGIIEHYQLAEIVGEPTAGTNGDVSKFRLPGGCSIMWTGMKVLKHDGSQHHGVGIQPTVFVSRTIQGIAEGRDEQLERAIEIVKQAP